MGLGAEGFTVLAVLEARDMASEIYDKVQAKLGEFSGSLKAAADEADASGAKIDESFLKTASGADALTVATANVEAAQARQAAATKAQADAEKALLDARAQVTASADGDTAAMDRQVAAADALAKAQKTAADASAKLSDAQAAQVKVLDAQSTTADESAAKNDASGVKLGSVASAMGKMGLGITVAGGLMAKGAADFQSSTTVLETSGGEAASQMDLVRKGILNLSGSTGTALDPLVKGMYMIGSAGYTGQQGLNVLQAAAQGAKAEGADLGTVSNALTTIMKNYDGTNLSVAQSQKLATQTMDQMIAVVSNGKTTTEELSASLSAVLPVASAAHLGFDQVGGALATMTGEGMSAQQASQNLANAIRSLQSPNAVAVKEMQAMGLNANTVSQQLSSKGLTGTIAELTGAITSHMGPAGTVMQSTFTSSAQAAKDANAEIAGMPKNLQSLAKEYLNGSVTAKQWKTDLQGLDPINQHMMQQFAGTADKTHAFNDLLAQGGPAAQTYQAALSKMMGGATGLNTALMLGGNNMGTFQSNVGKVKDAAKGAGASVDGWGAVQQTFNQKLAEAKQSVEATGISIGTALLPAVMSILQEIQKILAPILSWVQGHQKLTAEILGGAAALGLIVGAIGLASKAFGAVKAAVQTVGSVVQGVTKLFGLFSGSTDAAAASQDTAAASADALAVSEDGAAASTEANTVASDANGLSWIRSGLAAVGAAAKYVVLQGAQLAVSAGAKIAAAAQWLFNAAMSANPITIVVLALMALAAGVVWAYTHFKAFRDVVQAIWDWLKTAVVDVVHFVEDTWKDIVGAVEVPIDAVSKFVQSAWSDIKRWFTDGVKAVEDAVSWFASLPGKFLKWLGDAASAVSHGIGDAVSWFAGLPGRVISAIFGFFGNLGSKFGEWIHGCFLSLAKEGLNIMNWFTSLPGKIIGWLGDIGSTLVHAGASLIQGFIHGITSAFDDVKNTLGHLTHDLTSWKGPPDTDAILLKANGQLVIQGFIAGIDDQIPAVKAKLAGLTASIGATPAAALPVVPATGPGTGGAGAGAVVNINMADAFRGANILSDRCMDDLITKVGNALATRILPSGGLHVAM